jgi:hypothetical protein
MAGSYAGFMDRSGLVTSMDLGFRYWQYFKLQASYLHQSLGSWLEAGFESEGNDDENDSEKNNNVGDKKKGGRSMRHGLKSRSWGGKAEPQLRELDSSSDLNDPNTSTPAVKP